jgi:hypothetical protein
MDIAQTFYSQQISTCRHQYSLNFRWLASITGAPGRVTQELSFLHRRGYGDIYGIMSTSNEFRAMKAIASA